MFLFRDEKKFFFRSLGSLLLLFITLYRFALNEIEILEK